MPQCVRIYDDDRVVLGIKIFGIFLPTQTVRKKEIKRLVKREALKGGKRRGYEISIITPKKSYHIGVHLSLEEAQWLYNFLKENIFQTASSA